MTISLFTFVDLYDRILGSAEHLLGKGAEHAKAHNLAEADLLDWRLIADMQPLRFQLAVVCNFTQQWPARVAGLDVPPDVSDQLDVAGFQAALAASRAWLAKLTPEKLAGRDDVPLTYTIGNGMTPTLPSGQWLTVFATTNLYFHLSTAYGIMRSKGVQIGKADLFAGRL